MTFFNDSESLEWLREVHTPDAPCFASAEIVGNEDCPERVTLWAMSNPTVYTTPVAEYIADDEGNLK